MNSDMDKYQLYEPPVTTAEPLEVFTILAGSETPRNIELPFDSGESTSEALSNDNSSLWDDDSEERNHE
jgi:hypothetical protein